MFHKLLARQSKNFHSVMKNEFAKAVKRVAITGAAGQIGYSLLFRIASGQLLGADQPIIIQLVDLPQAQNILKGVKMEIDDCAFPLVQDVICTDNASVGFKDTDFALLVGAKPRGPGMERADLLKDNGKIFINTGKAIADNSSRDVKVIVVGNPTNTNCLILAHYAKGIPKENFTAMTRLDHNRGIYQLAQKLNVKVTDITNFSIWGNHSPTMVPLLSAAKVNGKNAFSLVDEKWVTEFFNPKVGKRGAEIIEARKLSSAASAGNAAIEHIRDWHLGAKDWVSMAVHSDGSYGVPKGLVFSFPCKVKNGKYEIVQGIKIPPYYQKLIDKTTKELLDERKAVEQFLK